MHKWRLEYLLKNGAKIIGMYEGLESQSKDVIDKLMVGPLNGFISTFGKDTRHNLLVMRGEVAAVEISEWR